MQDASSSRVPEGVALAIAVVVSSLAVVGGLWLWSTRNSDTSTTAAPSTTVVETTAPAPSPTPPSTENPSTQPPTSDEEQPGFSAPEYLSVCPDGDDTVALICDLVHFVETERGRPFKSYPTVELEPDADFDARLLRDFEEEVPDLRAVGETLRSLGIIDADADLAELFRASLEVGVVGFYRTDTEELVVRGSDLGLYEQSVLVHELVHAFDDQWFDLDRPEFENADDDSPSGFTAIVEGNASRIEEMWVQQLSREDLAELRRDQLTILSPSDLAVLNSLPRFLLEVQISPYTDGRALVEAIDARGGEDAVDAAFDDPPETTEQVLDPTAFFADEQALPVADPTGRGQVIDEGTFGQLSLQAWLGRASADGWGGDRYVTYEADLLVCTEMNIVMDSEREAVELLTTLAAWADQDDGRSVQSSNGVISLTGCVQ